MDMILRSVGEDLVETSRSEETSARGLVTQLFPFIAVAAKRMSARSISRYLQERHAVKISAVTIAKALREPAKHLEPFAEKIEIAGRRVADAHGLTVHQLLSLDGSMFGSVTSTQPTILGLSAEEASQEYGAYQDAVRSLLDDWFSADADVRTIAMEFIASDEDSGSDEEAANE